MKKRRSQCSIASAKPKRPSSVLGLGAIGAHAWRAHVRACASASGGEERFCAKSVGKCRRYKMVCTPAVLVEICRPHFPPTAGLTDYEVRDINDEINKLLREKRHWENQIIALGGANYRRNVAMLDDDGREVPGTKGYKFVDSPPIFFLAVSPERSHRYFGRAKELPGVKELFESRKKEEDEENATSNFYKRFTNQGPAYFGDLDEADGELLKYEEAAEQAGNVSVLLLVTWAGRLTMPHGFDRVGGSTHALA